MGGASINGWEILPSVLQLYWVLLLQSKTGCWVVLLKTAGGIGRSTGGALWY